MNAIFRAAWVVPVSTRPIRDGAVAVRDGRIARVGPASKLPDDVRMHAAWTDLGDAILTPGLVNPHTHLELTCYAGAIPPGPFWSWIRALVRLRAAPGQVEREQQGVYDGAWQSLRAGVTCVGDISRRNLHWSVLKDVPIRKTCFVELLSLADHPPRTLAELRAAAASVEEDALLTMGLSPHAPYSVPAQDVQGALRLAEALDRPWCTHWAETPEECAFLRGERTSPDPLLAGLLSQCGVRSPTAAPWAYLAACAAGVRPGAIAHYNYAEQDDVAWLAEAGHVVMYCPRAHSFFGHAPHPIGRMLRAGVTVALGTDSAASNQDLSLLAEARFLKRRVMRAADDPGTDHRHDACSTSDRAYADQRPDDGQLVRMITLDAARALRQDAQIGSLESGKWADLAAFACPADCDDPAAHLVDAAPQPIGVWVAGRRVIPTEEAASNANA